MEVADIEEERRQLENTTDVQFTTYEAVTTKEWEELESQNYLNLHIHIDTVEEELPSFLTELLSRRKKASFVAVVIHFASYDCEPERDKKLLSCFEGTLSSKSRVYLR